MSKEAEHQRNKRNGSVLMIFMLMVAVFFSMASRAVFSPIMPSVQNELGISLATAGSLFLYVSVSFAVAILLVGFLAARIGHGMTIVTSMTLLTLGMLISAMAPNVILVIIGLIFLGSGAGIYPTSAFVMINRKISPRKRTFAYGIHEISPNFALIFAPLFVLAVEPFIGWRGVLLTMSVTCGMATIAFWRWGAPDSGFGAAPNFRTIGKIIRIKELYVAMMIFSSAIAGLQGVFSILPAYLVEQSSHSMQEVNSLLVASRGASIFCLLFTGMIVGIIGKRQTIIWALLFTALATGLVGILEGLSLNIIIVMQPALIAVVFPPLLSSMAEIGDSSYQNITTSLIITAGMCFGAGLVPTLLGTLGDFGIGWLGFALLGGFMVISTLSLLLNPRFGR